MKTRAIILVILAGLAIAVRGRAQTNTNVIVSFTTTNATPLNIGFAGFTTEMLGKGEEYGDTNLQRFASMLSPGWLLFPGGTTGDAFSWSNGLTDTGWVARIGMMEGPNNPASNLCSGTVQPLIGKGGVWFTNFANLAATVGGAKIIVCVNGFTDTNTSAGAFAAFALSNHIHVSVWELCNEPYLFQGTNDFFTNGTDYANKMKPYRDAIKAADSNAVVAVFFSDPGRPGMSWDNALGNYSNQWWDAVVYHYYPQMPTNVPFADLMALDNGFLFSNTTLYVTNTLIANSSSNNTAFLMTEFAPGSASTTGTVNPPTSTLYGGIYGAEMVMRLSTCPRISFAGSYQLVDSAGIDTTNDFRSAVDKAASGGYTTNTTGLPFGYFLSAQALGQSVAYWAINRSTGVFPTSVGTNGPTVPMDTNGNTTMPAIYATAYRGGNGRRYVLLTNKGSNSAPVQITQDGAALTNQLLETYIYGTDPSAVNVNPPSNNLAIATAVVTNPVAIPQYSVVRLEWTVSNIPEPTLTLTASGSARDLTWAGLTSVLYNVQGATSLPGNWTTLGRVSGSQTNFAFTNWSLGPQQFYRLLVP